MFITINNIDFKKPEMMIINFLGKRYTWFFFGLITYFFSNSSKIKLLNVNKFKDECKFDEDLYKQEVL